MSTTTAPIADIKDPEKAEIPSNFEDGSPKTEYSRDEDAIIEKSLLKKLDWNLVPLVSALYLLAFLDRGNIGNANTAGMSKDLGISDPQYQWFLTIFYISYIIFEFQALMWKVVPPNIWGSLMVFLWGVMSTSLAGIHSWSAGVALRFFLGMFEAAYGPGIPYLLSFFYLRHEVGSRIGFFLACAPLANTFSGALAYGITSAKNTKIESWRILFLVEGLPTIAIAPVVYFFLPNSPQHCRFLNEDEKRVAKARGVRQAGAAKRVGGVNFKEVFRALTSVRAWLTALMYFSCNVSFASLPVFLPTIIANMGFAAADAQGLTAPPFFASFLMTCFTTWLADRIKQRGLVIIPLAILGGIGYVLLATCHSVGARYTGCVLAACGIFPVIANILPWVTNNQGSDSARGGAIVLLNVIGQCGPLLGTRLYPASEGPYFVKGQSVCAAFMFFTAILAVALRTLLWWENKKLDKKYGLVSDQMVRAEEEKALQEAGRSGSGVGGDGDVGMENYGPMFRFVL